MAATQQKKTAIVVGAGVGGVATAARLAHAGLAVTLVEKNDFTGGRCSTLRHGGYRFDQGPSLLLLPRLFAEAFGDLGTSLAGEGVRLVKCEPNYRVMFADGQAVRLSTDTAVMKAEVERWEGPRGFERYLAWLAEAHRHYEISVVEVLHRNFESLLALARPRFLKDLFRLHPFESCYARAAKYFATERLRRVFTFATMYMGMSPFDAPGTYSLLQYTELAEGIWYPIGGFNVVVQALERICRRLGVDIRLSTPVREVKTSADGKRATGVVLETGEELQADVVVVNADLVYAYSNLFPSQPPGYAQSLRKRDGSCSSVSFYWALDRIVPGLETHNIFLADDYRESFDSIFKDKSIPTEPSFYVNVPSRVDPSAAPEGKDAVVVLVPVGHLLDPGAKSTLSSPAGISSERDWDAIVKSARRTILQTIAQRTGVDLEAHIVHEQLNTPVTWRDSFNLDKGSILGLSHSFFNVLAFRPKTRHATLPGCYFVGASTHPGTGVPIVLAGSKITSEQILSDLGMSPPWSAAAASASASGLPGRKSGSLDGYGHADLDSMVRKGLMSGKLLVLLTVVLVLVTSMYLAR